MSRIIEAATKKYLAVLAREMPKGQFELPFTPFGCGLVFMRQTKELFDRFRKGEVMQTRELAAGQSVVMDAFGERRAGVYIRDCPDNDTVLISLDRPMRSPGFGYPLMRAWVSRRDIRS